MQAQHNGWDYKLCIKCDRVNYSLKELVAFASGWDGLMEQICEAMNEFKPMEGQQEGLSLAERMEQRK